MLSSCVIFLKYPKNKFDRSNAHAIHQIHIVTEELILLSKLDEKHARCCKSQPVLRHYIA